jgi:hypothetical protein
VKRPERAFPRERRKTVSDEQEKVGTEEAERLVSRVKDRAPDEVEDDDFEGHKLTVERVLRSDDEEDEEAGRVL